MIRRPHTFFTVLLLVILCAVASGYAQNPFLSDGPEEAEEKEGKTSVGATLRYPASSGRSCSGCSSSSTP
jgi:hypothetical protein